MNVDLGCYIECHGIPPSLFLYVFHRLAFLCSYLIGGTIPLYWLWCESFPYSSVFVSDRQHREKMKKMKCGKCHGRFLHGGAFSCERTGIIVFCIVRTFVSTVLFAQFSLFRMLVLVFHCITIYKQPPPSQGHPIHTAAGFAALDLAVQEGQVPLTD